MLQEHSGTGLHAAFPSLFPSFGCTLPVCSTWFSLLVGGVIGITETMLCQGAVGVASAVLGGQHLSILRPTGPVVAFMQAILLHSP